MRALVIVCALFLLGGCNALVRENGDYFQASSADTGRFEVAARACGIEAGDYLAYDQRGMSGSFQDRNRSYNAAYRRCMAGRGYKPRPYWKNFLPE